MRLARYSSPDTDFEKLVYLLEGRNIRFSPFPRNGASPVETLTGCTIEALMIERLVRRFKGCLPIPIRIENAVIKGPLNLTYATFKGELSITNSVIMGPVDFSFATFERSVIFDGSQFLKKADFRASHAMADFRVSYAQFLHDSCFMDVRIDEVFRAEGAQFADVTFQQAQFNKRVLFCPRNPEDRHAETRYACFNGNVSFTDASIKGFAHFEGARFRKRADFNRIHIHSSASFSCYAENSYADVKPVRELAFIRTCFGGEVNFAGARIEGTAYFEGARFHEKATFDRIWVGGHALFHTFEREGGQPSVKAHFSKEARFLAAYIGGNAGFDGACFERSVTLERTEIRRNALFRSFVNEYGELIVVEFKGLANFLGSHIFGDAEFSGAQFVGAEKNDRAWFESINIDGNAYFDDTYHGNPIGHVVFKREANFFNAHFHHQAVFRSASFEAVAEFTNVDVEGVGNFKGAEFNSETRFISAHFLNQADFSFTHFRGATDFTDVEIDGASFFNNAKFLGQLILRAARFKSLDLLNAQFVLRRLVLRWDSDGNTKAHTFKRRWVFVKKVSDGNVDMRGFTCEHINVDWDQLSQSMHPFDRQPYTLIEKSFRASGKHIDADSVYFELCCREGQELRDKIYRRGKFNNLSGMKLFNELGRSLRDVPRALLNLVEGVGFHHGIRPYRLLLFSLIVIVMGAYVFNQKDAISAKEKEGQVIQKTKASEPEAPNSAEAQLPPRATVQPTFSDAINVSLNQFIPLVNIPPGSEWVPSNKPVPFLKALSIQGRSLSFAGYAAFHRLLGFILIPLGVAALTGILHRRDKRS